MRFRIIARFKIKVASSRNSVPNFAGYLRRGQVEVILHSKWYVRDGTFSLERVFNVWIDKLKQALSKGYDGIRLAGSTA